MKTYKLHLDIPIQKGEYALFGIPQSNHYQHISNIYYSNSPIIIHEKELKNEIGCFTLNDVLKSMILSFSFSPKSVTNTINPKWTIDDYKNIVSQNLNLLKPNRFINGQDPTIQQISKRWNKENNILKIVSEMYTYVLTTLSYGKPTENLYSYSQVLENKTTDCGGFSTLLLSLLQSKNIPGRLVVGFVTKENIFTHVLSKINLCQMSFAFFSIHAWTEILLPDESWFPMDPSIQWRRNKQLTKRKGGFGFLPDDRLVTSFGQDFHIAIHGKKYNIDLLQNPIYI